MTLKVGETVIYPHHGAAKILDIKTEVVNGKETEYLVLQVTQGDLEIEVPAANVELIGVRDVVDEEGVKTVLGILSSEYIEEVPNWSRRYKANQEKIATGDIMRVAEVVRDLSSRDTQKGLSAGEKRMLQKARGILSSELALACNMTEVEAETLIDDTLGLDSGSSLAETDEQSGSEQE